MKTIVYRIDTGKQRNSANGEQFWLPVEVNAIEVGPFKIFKWPIDPKTGYQRPFWEVQHKSKFGLPWSFKRRKDAIGFCKKILEVEAHRIEYEKDQLEAEMKRGNPVADAIYASAKEAAWEFGGMR